MTDLVTIGIPTRNRARYVDLAVRSACAQSHANVEVLVSDNASTDGTPAVLTTLARRDPRVRIMTQRDDVGMVGNWNHLLAHARGSHFLLLSDDDVLLPHSIATLLHAMQTTGAAFARGPYVVIDENGAASDVVADGVPGVENGEDFLREYFKGRRQTCPASMLFPLDDLSRAEFDSRAGYLCDMVQRVRLASHGSVATVPDAVALYRIHSQSLTFSGARFIEDFIATARLLADSDRELARWSAAARRMAAHTAHVLALSAALRGRADRAEDIVKCLRAEGLERPRFALQVRAAASPAGRALGKMRRALMRRRAAAYVRRARISLPV